MADDGRADPEEREKLPLMVTVAAQVARGAPPQAEMPMTWIVPAAILIQVGGTAWRWAVDCF